MIKETITISKLKFSGKYENMKVIGFGQKANTHLKYCDPELMSSTSCWTNSEIGGNVEGHEPHMTSL